MHLASHFPHGVCEVLCQDVLTDSSLWNSDAFPSIMGNHSLGNSVSAPYMRQLVHCWPETGVRSFPVLLPTYLLRELKRRPVATSWPFGACL